MRNIRVKSSNVLDNHSGRYVIGIPSFSVGDRYSATYYRMPKDVYDHKQYPTCRCGRKFVPINKGDTECFFCNFTTSSSKKVTLHKVFSGENTCYLCGSYTKNKAKQSLDDTTHFVRMFSCLECLAKKNGRTLESYLRRREKGKLYAKNKRARVKLEETQLLTN